jgi:serine/threonine-protein kinase
MLQPGLKIEGRYVLVRELGSGGMGSVWLVRHAHLGAPFAAKFLHYSGANSSVKPRFLREARLAARLRGPHTPQIFDLGEWQGLPYILMEFLEGEDLRARLDRGVLSTTEMMQIVIPVARVLLRAHALGIVHRDLKPENVFLSRLDGEETVKVLDFGIAKVMTCDELASVVTRTNATLGTPFYMSPEQLRNSKEIDHRTDLWAFALLVFEMLTGRRAFAADSISQLVLLIETTPPPDILQFRPDLPPALGEWWRKAAARHPADRFQDAAELLNELARALALPAPGLSVPEPADREEPKDRSSGAFLPTEGDPGETTPSLAQSPSLPLPSAPVSPASTPAQRSEASLSGGAPAAPWRAGSLGLLGVGLLAGAFWLGQRSGTKAPSLPPAPLPTATAVTSAPLSASPEPAPPPPLPPVALVVATASAPVAAPSSGGPLKNRPTASAPKRETPPDTIGF